MFTGIVSHLGSLASVRDSRGGRELSITADKEFYSDSNLGDSLSVNGICLTLTAIDGATVSVFVQIETLNKTTLGIWNTGDVVNLEHPLRLNDLLGGHMVQGHVDGVATITNITELPDGSTRVSVSVPQEFCKYIVDKGSVCLNGVSLTVASTANDTFDVALIPATLEKTTFGSAQVGDTINLEIDCIARYVEQLISAKV